MVFFVAVAGASAYGIASSVAYTPPSATPQATNPGAAATTGQNSSGASPSCTEKLVKTVTSQGYELQTFLSSTSAKKGDVVCINVVLLNIYGRNLTLGSHSGYVTSYNITESDGSVVYQKSCTTTPPVVSSENASNSGSPIGSWSCAGYWSTGTAYDGTVPSAGTYDIVVIAFVPEMVGPGQSEVGSTTTIALLD
jgi:hypothetical protein